MKLSKDIKEYKVNSISLYAISLSFLGIRFRKRGLKSKEIAYSLAAKVRNDILNGEYDPKKYSVADYDKRKFKDIIQKSYYDYGRELNRPATRILKDSLLRLWILPALGNVPMGSLDNQTIENLYRRTETKTGGLAVSKTISSTLNSIFRDAYKLGLVNELLRAPGVSYKPTKPQRFLSVKEVMTLLEANKNHKIGGIMATLYYCALRIGEVTALQVKDYNKTFKTLSITKTSTKGQLVENTKNKRTGLIKVPEKLIPYLDKAVEGKEDKDFIFGKTRRVKGNPTLIISSVNQMIRNGCKRAGMSHKGISSHIFRRSMSQHLIEAKVSPRSIAKYLRDKPTTIMNHYAAENTEEIRNIIDDM